MPVPAVIAAAADNYRFNSDFLVKMVQDLTPEEWTRRPEGATNHIAWIVGHVVWTRKQLLARLGAEWSLPWLDLFGRGVKCDDTAAYPSPGALIDGWREVSGVLAATLETASEEALSQPSTKGPPSTDGKVSGVVSFLAIHETYHIGQASYLRAWLGHKGLMG
ncbi:MAG: DinB family protein [Terracidiphilus sp.]|jgi:uncharacterized damage-inducible protein DinB